MMKEKKLEEMIINDLASLKEDKDSVDEKICLRCGVEIGAYKVLWDKEMAMIKS